MSEKYLGYIVWHSLASDTLFDLELLTKLADELEINITLPSPPTKANLFKRACKTATFKYDEEHIASGVTRRRVYVAPVKDDAKSIVRQIRRDRVNKTTGLNVTEDMHSIVFDKKTQEYSYEPFELDLDSADILSMIDASIAKAGTIDHLAMRNIVRTYIESTLEGLWLRSGTYFIAEEKLLEARKLYDLCYRLGHSKFQIIPLVSSQEQELMVLDSFTKQLVDTMDEFENLLNSLINSEKQPTANEVIELEDLVNKLKLTESRCGSLITTFKAPPYYDMANNMLTDFLEELKKEETIEL